MRVILYCRVSSDEQADGQVLTFKKRLCAHIVSV